MLLAWEISSIITFLLSGRKYVCLSQKTISMEFGWMEEKRMRGSMKSQALPPWDGNDWCYLQTAEDGEADLSSACADRCHQDRCLCCASLLPLSACKHRSDTKALQSSLKSKWAPGVYILKECFQQFVGMENTEVGKTAHKNKRLLKYKIKCKRLHSVRHSKSLRNCEMLRDHCKYRLFHPPLDS